MLADLEPILVRATLTVIDTTDAALELHNLSPDKTVDIQRFHRVVIGPLRRHGASLILIDHVVKDAAARGKYATGNQRKIGVADVHLGFEAVQPFGRGRQGVARIVTHKDRPGHLPRPRAGELVLNSDADTGRITWNLRPAPVEQEQDTTFRPTVLMERISRHLEIKTEPIPRGEVERDVKGNTDWKRKALDTLVADGHVRETSGAHGARLVASIRAYRADDLAHSSPIEASDDLARSSPMEESHLAHPRPSSPRTSPRDLAHDGESPYRGLPSGMGEVDATDDDHLHALADRLIAENPDLAGSGA